MMCLPLLCSLILRMPMRDYTMFLLRNTILIVVTALIATVLMLIVELVDKMIRELKRGKAAGLDGLMAEHLV